MKKIKKLLEISTTYFKLPDDFKGTYPDALRLFADYIEKPSKDIRDKRKFCDHTIWDEFLRTVKKGGKTLGRFKLLKLVRNKWVKLHKNPYRGIKFIKSKKRGRKK